jgi:hypothetical protein
MRQVVGFSVALLLVSLLAGCGSKRPRPGAVSGTITYKGQPLSGAALLLYPAKPGAAEPITIPVDDDGSFRITDVPRGEYKVVVEGTEGSVEAMPVKAPPGKEAEMKEKLARLTTPPTIPFPKKYQDRRTTDLTCTVTDRDQTVKWELKD